MIRFVMLGMIFVSLNLFASNSTTCTSPDGFLHYLEAKFNPSPDSSNIQPLVSFRYESSPLTKVNYTKGNKTSYSKESVTDTKNLITTDREFYVLQIEVKGTSATIGEVTYSGPVFCKSEEFTSKQ